ncbi:hypothetical protein [Chitinophaga polysaccharea]|uniref:hypothetical protein n=1 Tax=Chitinophaga polysaccharea TaxID=1293035 RepID=UPI00115AE19E|nr:hypothetical protein [Chitinophaga polysaccharea]
MRNKITSLLIEEKADQRIQFYLSLDLLKVNHACVCQDNTTDALAWLKRNTGFVPDYIFISSAIPVAHAALFIRQLRQLKGIATVPVLHFAAPKEQLSTFELNATGFTDCLVKQPDIYYLRDALKVIFEKDYHLAKTTEEVPILNNVASRIREMMENSVTAIEAPRRLSA